MSTSSLSQRLAALLVSVLAIAGCGARTDLPGALDVQASYEMRRTERPTLPRCYHGHHPMGARYTPADVAAVREMRIGIIEQSDVITAYRLESGIIAIEPWMPHAVLLHEVCHAGQLAGHHDGEWQRETGAMICEVAALQAEGWSDDRIRELSPNNGQTPTWVFTWIRQLGPQFSGNASDVMVAYEWGKSAATFGAVSALAGAP